MADGRVAFAEGLLSEAVAELRDAMGADALDDEIVAALRVGYGVERELQRVRVGAVAALLRRGVFAQRGQRAEYAVADLLGIDFAEARQVVIVAEHVIPPTDLQGQVLPARLPATAAAFAAGVVGLRQVEVIARVMAGPAAERLSVGQLAGAEAQIAAVAGDYTPVQLRSGGPSCWSCWIRTGSSRTIGNRSRPTSCP